MKSVFVSLSAVAVMAAPALAVEGKISLNGEEDGAVKVLRGVQVLDVTDGMSVMDGDKIVGVDGGAYTLALENCELDIPANSEVDINDATCQVVEGGTIMGMSTTTAAVVGGAIVAGGVVIANNDDDDDDPASP